MQNWRVLCALVVAGLLVNLQPDAVAYAETPAPVPGLDKIKHVIVIYQENWSFDGLYGKFPGANGIANAGTAAQQVDKDGTPYKTLPQPNLVPSNGDANHAPDGKTAPDPRFPADLPVGPFDMGAYISPGDKTGDLVHRFYQNQYQIDGGKNDKFVAWSDAAGLTMGYFDATNLPEGKLAQEYTLADNFFQAAFGGSFLNHIWLVCACSPEWKDAPAPIVAQLDDNGMLIKDGAVTPDGYVVNTSYTVNTPHPAIIPSPLLLMPQQYAPTIGDRLSDKQIPWAWYSGGWDNAVAGNPDPTFQFHHQPFAYFANYADGTPGRAAHLKDEKDFLADLKNGTLPAVSFVKPLGIDNEHPGYSSLLQGQQHAADLIKAVQESSYWPNTAIFIVYDENGGRWDHVAPPVADRWGPGTRIPAIIISPYAKRGFVDHTQYDTTSVLKFIETRWGLEPLTSRDAAANDLTAAFDFAQAQAQPAGTQSASNVQAWILTRLLVGLIQYLMPAH